LLFRASFLEENLVEVHMIPILHALSSLHFSELSVPALPADNWTSRLLPQQLSPCCMQVCYVLFLNPFWALLPHGINLGGLLKVQFLSFAGLPLLQS